jgi:uroporphyrinogen decarboxylase
MPADLGYRNATLFSPKLYERLIFPAHKKLVDYQHDHGRQFMCHSCGKIDVLIPKFIEAGFDAIQPLEAKCGQDVRELKKLYAGKITLFGNIDIRKLSGTRQDVEEEVVSKIEVAKQGGGYIFHSDHSVPPTVSFENYCYAVELVKKHGWCS